MRKLAKDLDFELYDLTQGDAVSYAVVYGEFEYKAGSWDYPRRVVRKIEKPYGQMIHMNTFIVTNMDSSPEDLIRFYCKRGNMKIFIKECKIGFDMSYVSSFSQIVNAQPCSDSCAGLQSFQRVSAVGFAGTHADGSH